VIDAADKSHGAVDHHDLAVHAAQHVHAPAQQAFAGIEYMDSHAGMRERLDECAGEVRRAEAVDRHVHLHAAPGRRDQGIVQLRADLVLEQDEGFQHHFVSAADASNTRGKSPRPFSS
jgi:hypothetical protein